MFKGKPGLRILVIAMAIAAFMSVSLVSAEETYNFNSKSPMNASVRSLMLPGWGQFFNEQPTKGMIFAGAELIAIGAAFMTYSGANSTYSDYETQRTTALYDDYSSKIGTANMFVYLAAAIWAGNVFDAYLSADSGASTPRKKTSTIKKSSKKKKAKVEEVAPEEDATDEEQMQEETPTPKKTSPALKKSSKKKKVEVEEEEPAEEQIQEETPAEDQEDTEEQDDESRLPGSGFYLQAKGLNQIGIAYRYTF